MSPTVVDAHNKMLQHTNAKYFSPRADTRLQSIPTGKIYFKDKIPSKAGIGFVKSTGSPGKYVETPCNVLNCNITSICLYADDVPVMGKPLKLNFNNNASIVRAYSNLFVLTNKWNQDYGISITEQQCAGGSTVFGFDLNPYFHDL